MTRTYQNLILGLRTHESSAATEILVGGNFDVGFDTPREALEHFQESLMVLVKEEEEMELARLIKVEACPKCKQDNDEFCRFCGRRFEGPQLDLNTMAAAKFADWFQQQLHELEDWEGLSQYGWNLGWISRGGFVKLDGFEGYLEGWNPEGWEDRLGRKNDDGTPWSWWDALLDDVTTGEITLDGDEDSKA